MPNICVFDVETSGLNVQTDRIIEIAWQVVRDGVAGEVQHHAIFDPGLTSIPPDVTAVNGWTVEALASLGMPPREVLRAFTEASWGMLLVAHNGLRFDCPMVKNALSRDRAGNGDFWAKRVQVYDTAAVYKAAKIGMFPRPGELHIDFARRVLETKAWGVRYSLEEVCRALGIKPAAQLHRAEGDVATTRMVYDEMVLRGLPAGVL